MQSSTTIPVGARSAGDTPPQQICYLVAPLGQTGGGMGRVMDNLMSASHGELAGLRLVALDSRGPGSALASICYTACAIGHIVCGAVRGRAALVHINVGDRGSLFRKGLIIFLAWACRVPILLHLHAVQHEPYFQQLNSFGKAFVRAMFHAARRVVVLGQPWRRWLLEEIKIPDSRIAILQNGVPFSPQPRVARSGDSPFRILFLGNLLERKGVSDLLAALASVPSGFSWRATLAGGGDIGKYQKLAAELGIADYVHFAGWLDQDGVGQQLAAQDLLVLPSYDEGLPLVILEALAASVPVICTPVGAIPEIMNDGDTALMVTPGDRSGLAAALTRVMSDPALETKLRTDGRDLYDRRLTMAAFMDGLTPHYHACCRPRSPVRA